ncbi:MULTISPECIES: hypothetical protein [unclassified Saccharothrix]|uniref:hypothetical protein n=1 Tax=unclassified Saccharothrix TaxID=2593673 RepID=UPI00307DD3D9
MAGRVDDDALTQARELLAVAELDRAVELLVGCLLAGRIPVSVDERREIGWLLGEVRSDVALADRLFAVEQVPVPRHRFTVESDPADGLAEVLGKTLSVLPDVRSVRATWRSSPAGATPGPLPQRVVLVDIGPSGFAPATAYRVDGVLRRAGIRAVVEVLTVGTPLGEYHAAATSTAREVFYQSAASVPPPSAAGATWFDGQVRDGAPVVEPEPVPADPEPGSKPRRARAESFEGAQPFPPKPVKRLPVREVEEPVAEEPVEAPSAQVTPLAPPAHPSPAPSTEPSVPPSTPAQASAPAPAPVEEPTPEPEARPELPTRSSARPDPLPTRGSRADKRNRVEEPPVSRSEETTELNPDDLAALQAALADGVAPASVHLPPTVDAKLSDRERALLQQLHEELAQREQQSWPGGGPEYVNGVPKPNNGKYPG